MTRGVALAAGLTFTGLLAWGAGCTGPGADADAGVCTPNGGIVIPSETFDEALASYQSDCNEEAGIFSGVQVSTKECGGMMAILTRNGLDTQTMYLYDPSTKACLEVAGGANGENDCIVSVSGVPLATSCTYENGYESGGPFGFVPVCPTDGGSALGAACSSTDVSPVPDWRCLNGTWQNPCPAEEPQTGSACPFPASAYCWYPTSDDACCFCESSGTWSCEPGTCVTEIGDASADADTGAYAGDTSTDAGADVAADVTTDAAGE